MVEARQRRDELKLPTWPSPARGSACACSSRNPSTRRNSRTRGCPGSPRPGPWSQHLADAHQAELGVAPGTPSACAADRGRRPLMSRRPLPGPPCRNARNPWLSGKTCPATRDHGPPGRRGRPGLPPPPAGPLGGSGGLRGWPRRRPGSGAREKALHFLAGSLRPGAGAICRRRTDPPLALAPPPAEPSGARPGDLGPRLPAPPGLQAFRGFRSGGARRLPGTKLTRYADALKAKEAMPIEAWSELAKCEVRGPVGVSRGRSENGRPNSSASVPRCHQSLRPLGATHAQLLPSPFSCPIFAPGLHKSGLGEASCYRRRNTPTSRSRRRKPLLEARKEPFFGPFELLMHSPQVMKPGLCYG